MKAFLFPGQGAQYPGCLHTLGGPQPHACIGETIDEASDILQMDVRSLDTREALGSTVAVQLVLFVAAVATVRSLDAEGIHADAVAGLSVGAYGAAVACQAVSFKDALELLQLRASLMEQAYPQGYGMLAIVGLNEQQVGRLLASHPGQCAFLANVNAPRQIVISGADADLDAVCEMALKAGARKAERLAVSVPSHSILLDDAAQQLAKAAARITFFAPTMTYIGNRGARPLRQAEAIRAELASNLRYPVRWHESTVVLSEMGVKMFVEMPPGHTLTHLADEALPGVSGIAIDQTTMSSAAALIKARSRENR